jgi:hypothetical protein
MSMSKKQEFLMWCLVVAGIAAYSIVLYSIMSR